MGLTRELSDRGVGLPQALEGRGGVGWGHRHRVVVDCQLELGVIMLRHACAEFR